MKNVTVLPFGAKLRAIDGDAEFCMTYIAAKMVGDNRPVFCIDECVAVEDTNHMVTVREDDIVMHGGEVFDVVVSEDDEGRNMGFRQRPALSLLAA